MMVEIDSSIMFLSSVAYSEIDDTLKKINLHLTCSIYQYSHTSSVYPAPSLFNPRQDNTR